MYLERESKKRPTEMSCQFPKVSLSVDSNPTGPLQSKVASSSSRLLRERELYTSHGRRRKTVCFSLGKQEMSGLDAPEKNLAGNHSKASEIKGLNQMLWCNLPATNGFEAQVCVCVKFICLFVCVCMCVW